MSSNDANAWLGYRIRRRRKALDLTQARLAKEVGCAAATIVAFHDVLSQAPATT